MNQKLLAVQKAQSRLWTNIVIHTILQELKGGEGRRCSFDKIKLHASYFTSPAMCKDGQAKQIFG